MGLNATLSAAGTALDIYAAGIQVSGNNIANANDPNFIRETLLLSPSFPVQQQGLILGSGVTANGVKQQVDHYLQQRIYAANGEASGSTSTNSVYQQLESALQTLGSADLSTQLGGLTSAFNNVVTQPGSASINQLAIQQGVQFTQSITRLRSQIDILRQSINQNVDADVTEANNLIDDIARLNPRITALESAGLLQSDAGSLRDQRYADLNRLSQLLPVTVNDRGSAGVDVTLNGQALVIPGEVQHLQSVPRADRGMTVHDVTIVGSSTPITGARGELPGLISGRDDVIGGFLDKLDQFTSTIINQVNLIHASGQGQHGYTSVTGTYGIKDATLALDASGLPFTPQNGSFQVHVINTSTGLAQIATINVDLAGVNPKTTLNGGAGSIVSQLNGVANIAAAVNGDGELQIDAANGYQIEFSNDNSGTLAALGINTFFTGSTSGDVGVNSMLIDDPTLLAAAQGGGPGDATNAVQLANLGNLTAAALGGATISNFYQQTVTSLGSSSASQNAVSQGSQGFLSSLNNQRAQTTGVSLDTETIQIMQYQQAYQSAARLISTIDKLFTTLTQL